jgi:hypothetical protein
MSNNDASGDYTSTPSANEIAAKKWQHFIGKTPIKSLACLGESLKIASRITETDDTANTISPAACRRFRENIKGILEGLNIVMGCIQMDSLNYHNLEPGRKQIQAAQHSSQELIKQFNKGELRAESLSERVNDSVDRAVGAAVLANELFANLPRKVEEITDYFEKAEKKRQRGLGATEDQWRNAVPHADPNQLAINIAKELGFNLPEEIRQRG